MTNFSLTDQPILDASHDKLDRHPFAQLIANELLTNSDCNSGVVGLTGSWGSGKSSVANLVEKEIGENATVVRFEPWMIGTREALVQEFFITLGKGAFPNSKSKEQKEARERYLEFASRIANQFGPVAIALVQTDPKLQTAGLLIKAASNIDKVIQIFKKAASEPTLKESRDAIATDLEKIEKPVIVVIDDIDRLDKTEVKTVFQLVKACADFPNVKYLLLYDRDQVLHALQDSVNNPEAFLEKIVNQVFDLPEATTMQRELLIHDAIISLGLQIELSSIETSRLSAVIDEVLLPGLFTARHIKRFTNTVKPLLPGVIVNGIRSIEPADYLALEYLRQYVPSVYSVLLNEEAPKAGGISELSTSRSDRRMVVEKNRTLVIQDLPEDLQELSKAALNILFNPVMSSSESNSNRRYKTPEWRPVYLGFGHSRASLSEVDWRRFQHKLSADGDLSDWISEWDDRERRGRWVNAICRRSNEIPERCREKIITELFVWGEKQRYEEFRFATINHYTWPTALDLCCTAIINKILTEELDKLLESAITNSRALVSPALIFGIEVSRQLEGQTSRWLWRTDKNLANQLSEKLSNEILLGHFWNYPDPITTLIAWKYLNSDQYITWHKSLKDNPSELAKYLNICFGCRRNDIKKGDFSVKPYLLEAVRDIDPTLLTEDGAWARQLVLESAENSKRRGIKNE